MILCSNALTHLTDRKFVAAVGMLLKIIIWKKKKISKFLQNYFSELFIYLNLTANCPNFGLTTLIYIGTFIKTYRWEVNETYKLNHNEQFMT